ncbi:MAG: hypothetical protein HYZ83_01190 [Candidatus Omnitrophica bacterium]|nr:hypothetical protein [Candidatus Omnitrophota bacterium]
MPQKHMEASKDPVWTSPFFFIILILKIAASFFCGSDYLTRLFIPFINYFAVSGFKNPWEYFYSLDMLKMFPYPTVMLWVMALPRIVAGSLLSPDWHAVSNLHLMIMRIPLLLADLLLFSLLLRLFPTRQKRTLLIYWGSPILFFINYIHGQLDIVPTALFFAAVVFLIQSRYWAGFLLMAVAAASKTHIFIALPFILVYVFRKKIGALRLLTYLAGFFAAYGLLLLPYFSSEAFRQMVFNSPEQKRLFDFVIPLSSSLNLMVCPIVVVLLFIKFASYRKLNREILLMFLGIVFAALVVLVPPMPGWFMWSLPFLIYFYISNKEYSRAPFILYNAVYLVYFLFFFEREFSFPFKSTLPVKDLALSVMLSSVGFIAFWMFVLGIRKNEELKIAEAPLLVGIGGDSASGKHTLLAVLRNLAGKSRSIPIFGDDFHKWERGNENWQIYTHLDPTANRLHQSLDMAIALKDGDTIELGHYDHKSGKFTDPETVESNKFIFFVGLHPFYLKKMRSLLPIKIFMDTEETLKRYWKLQRDVYKRGHKTDDVLRQISEREEDRFKHIEPQRKFADLIIRYEASNALDLKHPSPSRPPLKVLYTMDNSVNLEDLVMLLGKIPTLRVESYTDIDAQQLEVSGTIRAREVMNTAFQLGFNLDELFINTRGWIKNHHGITQLVFLVLYNHQMSLKS